MDLDVLIEQLRALEAEGYSGDVVVRTCVPDGDPGGITGVGMDEDDGQLYIRARGQ